MSFVITSGLSLPTQRLVVRSAVKHTTWYSTQIPKKAAGAFTQNKYIAKPLEANAMNRTLVYIGPFAETIRRYKMTASLFGICGLCSVPALLSTGQAPILSVVLVHDDVKTVERQRKRPQELKDKWIGLERITFLGRSCEDNAWLSELSDKSNKKNVLWQNRKTKTIYSLEKAVVESDPYLHTLANRLHQK
ncbi:hypothetical protein EC973_008004 [Apophysomyces ossiformis]|uniref:Uncharacterized protein n=1 Tax=Apophysomyces ossiformis TaxID=679940 RepID=A0A8H7BU25_9FUNG|nr:hypothetical protein EC973_008004 [Apophysomyces ossiformis]